MGELSLDLPGEFEAFWTAYPRKVGKFDAAKSWARARKTVAAEVIMVGLERAKPGWIARGDAQFIPHPATWLNQGRWEDRPTEKIEVVLSEIGGFYARFGSPELDAWDRHWLRTRGVHAPRDRNFGYRFETRWPPEEEAF